MTHTTPEENQNYHNPIYSKADVDEIRTAHVKELEKAVREERERIVSNWKALYDAEHLNDHDIVADFNSFLTPTPGNTTEV